MKLSTMGLFMMALGAAYYVYGTIVESAGKVERLGTFIDNTWELSLNNEKRVSAVEKQLGIKKSGPRRKAS